jgi:hypothetical protein
MAETETVPKMLQFFNKRDSVDCVLYMFKFNEAPSQILKFVCMCLSKFITFCNTHLLNAVTSAIMQSTNKYFNLIFPCHVNVSSAWHSILAVTFTWLQDHVADYMMCKMPWDGSC